MAKESTQNIIRKQLKKVDYWGGDAFSDLLSDTDKAKEIVQINEPVGSQEQIDRFSASIERYQKGLLGEIEHMLSLMTGYLTQSMLVDIDQEVNVLMKKFEQELSQRLSQTMLDVQSSPLPPGTKFAIPFGNTTIYILEHEPTVRTIYTGSHKRTLAFPYMVFGVPIDKNGIPGHLHIGCSNKSLNSLDDPLSRIHLSNIYQKFNQMGVCDGAISGGTAHQSGETVSEKVNAVIKQFWSSAWSESNTTGMTSRCNDKSVATYPEWEKNTKKNPMFILKVKWQTAGINVRQFAEGLAGEKYGDGKGSARLNEEYRSMGRDLIKSLESAINTRFEQIKIDKVKK